jgi:5-hydroxyisourate hydrolase
MTSPLTTHVLNTATGRPAVGLRITLEVQDGALGWQPVSEGLTNADGRLRDLLPPGGLERRVYRLTFDTGSYFAQAGEQTFYPSVPVIFEVTALTEHHHVPLLISPFGYSTYRGS